jgi:hypothetical protein
MFFLEVSIRHRATERGDKAPGASDLGYVGLYRMHHIGDAIHIL